MAKLAKFFKKKTGEESKGWGPPNLSLLDNISLKQLNQGDCFSLHRPSGPIQFLSRNVSMSWVCVFVPMQKIFVTGDMKNVICDTGHMKRDMWNITIFLFLFTICFCPLLYRCCYPTTLSNSVLFLSRILN